MLSHAYGAAFDNPDLLVTAVIGDGEAETGALATGWHSNKLLHPAKDGVVLPILHLNGYKIANPTILARIPTSELRALMLGYGHTPYFFEVADGDTDHDGAHRRFAALLDEVFEEIARIKAVAHKALPEDVQRPAWPMIVFRTPKGWTGPGYIDGKKTTGSWRAHQVPLANARDTPEHLQVLGDWLASYRADELFDPEGRLLPSIAELAPPGRLRMSDNPHTNGGLLLKDLRLPDFRDFAVEVPVPGGSISEAPRVLGRWLTEVIRQNPENFRIFGPDETASNRLQAVFDVTDKQWNAEFIGPEVDEHLARAGRVLEDVVRAPMPRMARRLSTDRATRIVQLLRSLHPHHRLDVQPARQMAQGYQPHPLAPADSEPELPSVQPCLAPGPQWVLASGPRVHRPCGEQEGRRGAGVPATGRQHPVVGRTTTVCARASTSTSWCQKAAGAQFPDHGSGDRHCTRGMGIWEWAGSEVLGTDPDVVIAAAGDVPTLEALAAADLLRTHLPELKVRFVNVVDLMRLQDESEHPHGLSDREFDRSSPRTSRSSSPTTATRG